MLSSLVIALLSGRLSLLTEQSVMPVHIHRQASGRFTLLDLFICSFLILTAAALIWILAPVVIHIVHFFSPDFAIRLDINPSKNSSAAEVNWLLAKRVMLGYFALCLLCLLVFSCWSVLDMRLAARLQQTNSRWTILLEETDRE